MITITDLFFSYPGADKPALNGISLHIPDGELSLVIGPSGSGKSTLLRCINGLVPHFSGGSLSGKIRVNELDPLKLTPQVMSQEVGFVFQDPEAQFVVDRVEDEVAFSLENEALPRDQMESRVDDVLNMLKLTDLRTRRLETLSGGEMQRLAIASALALQPKILVLDEPTSQLDPQGADEVLQALVRLNKQLGITIVLAEHRLERVLPYAGQVIYLSEEYPQSLTGDPGVVLQQVELNPPLIALGKLFDWSPLPLTVGQARQYVKSSPSKIPSLKSSLAMKRNIVDHHRNHGFVGAKGVKVNYGRVQAVRGVDLSLHSGEITVMMGVNGAGKSTLLRSLIGLVPLKEGHVQVAGRDIAGRSVADVCQQVGYLPQDPNALLFADTVLEELLITLRNHHLDVSQASLQPELLLERLGLGDKIACYPRDLSAGERQRVALGAILVVSPGALLLDEPTRGLDYQAKQVLLSLLRGWREDGMAILMVTHDVELAVQAADRVILMEKGLISADGEPWEVLNRSSTFAPQVVKIFPDRGWLTVEDVIGAMNASEH